MEMPSNIHIMKSNSGVSTCLLKTLSKTKSKSCVNSVIYHLRGYVRSVTFEQ